MTKEGVFYRGRAYSIKNSIASESGVFSDVICADYGGDGQIFALCLLIKPIIKSGEIILYKFCTFRKWKH